MYGSYMSMKTFPLALPDDLIEEARMTASQVGVSMADAMRMAMKRGLPEIRKQLSPLDGLKPLTREESEQCWGSGSDPEWDRIANAMSKLPVPLPEE